MLAVNFVEYKDAGEARVHFYPNGTCDDFTLILRSDQGEWRKISLEVATGLASGTVYPILRRLEDSGMLRSKWEAVTSARDEQRPPRRYYQITGAGSSALRDASERFPGLGGTIGQAGAATA